MTVGKSALIAIGLTILCWLASLGTLFVLLSLPELLSGPGV